MANGLLDIVDRPCGRMAARERLGIVAIEGEDSYLVEIAHQRQQLQVLAPLYPGADDGGNSGVLARELADGEDGTGSSAQPGNVGPIHDACRRPRHRVEEVDDGKMTGQVERGIPLEDADHLDGDVGTATPRRHG